MASVHNDELKQVAGRISKSESVLFITGAGISADSGLPTYRGVGGLYEDTATEDGIPIEEALSGEMLRVRPQVTWKYLVQIMHNCRNARFNRGHEVIAGMERRFRRVWTLTQNIDGFHTDAGSRQVIEIHGNMRRLRCDNCGWHAADVVLSAQHLPPVCPGCGESARPDVVFFGEMLPEKELAIYENELSQGFDVYVWIGTTCVFPYIQAPLFEARRRGSLTVEINPGETAISGDVQVRVRLRAAEALEMLWDCFTTSSAKR